MGMTIDVNQYRSVTPRPAEQAGRRKWLAKVWLVRRDTSELVKTFEGSGATQNSAIAKRSLTQRRRAVVCWHSHHANTSFSQDPFLTSAKCRSSNSPAANPRASNRSASASPCARLASPL